MSIVLRTIYWLDAQGCNFFIKFSIHTIKGLLFWKITARDQVESTQITYTSDTIL